MNQLNAKDAGSPAGQWVLLGEDGGSALSFDSMLSLNISEEGKVLQYPLEAGSFAAYNKVQTPLEVQVGLASSGGSDHDILLSELKKLKKGTELVSLVTPDAFYENLALETFNYTRKRENGASLLAVDLTLREVIQVETEVTTTTISQKQARNPASVSTEDTGNKQPQNQSSILDILVN